MNPFKCIHPLHHVAFVAGNLLCAVVLGQSALAQNRCATQSSPINPVAATSPGNGGTGSRASRSEQSTEAESLTRRDNGGIGGTGMLAVRPGIGGTGRSEGGVGGTGIVGVITGFASICVNGVEVQFDAATPVSENGQPGSARQLAVGQVVAVRATGDGAALSASNIAMIDAAIGPIEAIDPVTGEFSLLGQKVQLRASGKLSDLKAGSWVRVSGLRLAQGEIAASRIDLISPLAQVQLNGTVTRNDADTISVEGTRVRFDAQQRPADLALGSEVLIKGQWDGHFLHAQQVQPEPTRNGLGIVDHVVLEGYIHKLEGNHLSLGLGPLTLGTNMQIVGGNEKQLTINQHIQVRGRVAADQSVRIERIDFSRSTDRGGRSKTLDSDSSGDKNDSSEKNSSGDSGPSETSGSSTSSSESGRSGISGDSGRSGDSGKSGSSGSSGSSNGNSGGSGRSSGGGK